MRNIVLVILLAVAVTGMQEKYRFCAPVDTINDDACQAIQRGDSKILCVPVADNADCAIHIAKNEADFGIFTAEDLLLAYKFYPSNIVPIMQLRHRDRQGDNFEYQTVVVVPKDLTQPSVVPGSSFDNWRNFGFCHPGFSKSSEWSDYVLKFFEKRVTQSRCQKNATIIDNELTNLKNFFGKACRPGDWAAEDSVNKELKKKYPELCALCDDQEACTYNNMLNDGHIGALDCLTSGRGKMAYVELSYARSYLKTNSSYGFLCKDGKTLPLDSNPCTWLRQPWKVVAAKREIASSLRANLSGWLKQTLQRENWMSALSKIIQEDSVAYNLSDISMAAYLSTGKDIDLNTFTCDRTTRWCTIGTLETNKCKWVARAAAALGVEPRISCVETSSTFECFRSISENRVDIMTIDSNYGHLARTVYGLSTVLYSETEETKNSVVIGVMREPRDNNYPVKSLSDLKGRTACFPEYAGISWLSFINIARKSGLISSRSCDYPRLMSKLLSGACTPGIKDNDHSHSISRVPAEISNKLCSVCMRGNNTSCAINETNHYAFDKGAMRCLNEGAGDIAFVEASNIIDTVDDSNKYRLLCKNGSLAKEVGFNFDELCAFSVTIDSEIVGRKNDSTIKRMDTILGLLNLEDWLGYSVGTRTLIHIYGKFNNTYDLLFKDSTSGLVTTSSTKKSVQEYKELFSHVYECSNGSLAVTVNSILLTLVAFYHLLPNRMHW